MEGQLREGVGGLGQENSLDRKYWKTYWFGRNSEVKWIELGAAQRAGPGGRRQVWVLGFWVVQVIR